LRWQPDGFSNCFWTRALKFRRKRRTRIGTRLAVAGRQPDVYTAAFREIQSCLLRQTPRLGDDVRSLLLEAIGIAAYANDEQRATAEAFLLEQSRARRKRSLAQPGGSKARQTKPETADSE
jgi:hypothetical protein